jgi:anti-anti-sigma regulatory factor
MCKANRAHRCSHPFVYAACMADGPARDEPVVPAADHLCFVYADDVDLATVVAPFLARGRALGRRILYSGPAPAPPLIEAAARVGVDLAACDAARAAPGLDLRGGVAGYAAALQDAFAAGCTGLCVVAELTECATASETERAALARWEHLTGRWQSTRPVSSVCAYDGRRLRSDQAADVACLHPRVRAAWPVTPFRLFFRDGELAVAGEVDAFSAPLLVRALSRVEAPAGTQVVIDASELRFVNHRGLLGFVDGLARRCRVAVTLRRAPEVVVRLHRMLELDDAEVRVAR